MNANRRPQRAVSYIVCVVRTEGAPLATIDYLRRLTRTSLLKTTGHHYECSGRRPMIVEAGGLSGQPADDPQVMVRTVIQPLIPTPIGAQPHPFHPSIRPRKSRNNVREFLRRLQNSAGFPLRCHQTAIRLRRDYVLHSRLHSFSIARPSPTSSATDDGCSTPRRAYDENSDEL